MLVGSIPARLIILMHMEYEVKAKRSQQKVFIVVLATSCPGCCYTISQRNVAVYCRRFIQCTFACLSSSKYTQATIGDSYLGSGVLCLLRLCRNKDDYFFVVVSTVFFTWVSTTAVLLSVDCTTPPLIYYGSRGSLF